VTLSTQPTMRDPFSLHPVLRPIHQGGPSYQWGPLSRTFAVTSPIRARARCAWTRLAVADLKRVTSGGLRLGNASPPIAMASLI
jgi:hypothetical protein